MILLDTNVISESMRARPDINVIEWLDAQAVETMYLAAISLAEIRFGITALPKGRRRTRLRDRFEAEVLPLFDGRVVAFDEPASAAYGDLRARCRAKGAAIGDFDALIAAIALSNGLMVATRDVAPFESAGIDVINPFAR